MPGIISVEIRPLLVKDLDDAFKISEYGQMCCRYWHAKKVGACTLGCKTDLCSGYDCPLHHLDFPRIAFQV